MYARTDKEFATRSFWWFFLIQPAPLPERMINADRTFFLRDHIAGQLKTAGAMEPDAFAEYLRCYDNPATVHAICEDYRAAVGIDLVDDAEDVDKRIRAPLMALWGAEDSLGHMFDVFGAWREKALDVQGGPIDCGHSPQEEAPEEVL
jgi:haloacetate dehalogenase